MPTPQTINTAQMGMLSYLFEAVGDLLTADQRQELTDQLTALRPVGVAPGDLITADLFNDMLNNINGLLARVAALEGEAVGAPEIDSILPIGQKAGQTVTISGRNFNLKHLNLIRFDSVDIPVGDVLPGSSSTRLIVIIPAVPNIGTSGSFIEVSVSNAAGIGRRNYFLTPVIADVMLSNFVAQYQGGFTPNIAIPANTETVLTFNVTGSSSKAGIFNVTPTIEPPTAGWSVSMAAGSATLAMTGNNATQMIPVQVRLTTGAPNSKATIKLTIRAQSAPTSGSDFVSDEYTVGSAPPASVSGILIESWKKPAPNPNLTIAGNVLTMSTATVASPKFFQVARDFNLAANISATIGIPQIAPNTGWTASLIPTTGQVLAADGSIAVAANAAANSRHTLTLRVQLNGTFNASSPTALDRDLTVPITLVGGTVQATADIRVRAPVP